MTVIPFSLFFFTYCVCSDCLVNCWLYPQNAAVTAIRTTSSLLSISELDFLFFPYYSNYTTANILSVENEIYKKSISFHDALRTQIYNTLSVLCLQGILHFLNFCKECHIENSQATSVSSLPFLIISNQIQAVSPLA